MALHPVDPTLPVLPVLGAVAVSLGCSASPALGGAMDKWDLGSSWG